MGLAMGPVDGSKSSQAGTASLWFDRMLHVADDLVAHVSRSVPGHLGDHGVSSLLTAVGIGTGSMAIAIAIAIFMVFLLPWTGRKCRIVRASSGAGGVTSSLSQTTSDNPSSSPSSPSSPSSLSCKPRDSSRREPILLRTLESIPGPPKAWYSITGHLYELAFGERPQPFVLRDWSRRFGPISKYYRGRFPTVLINNLELAKHVAIRNFQRFHDRPGEIVLRKIDGMGIIFTGGKRWMGVRLPLMMFLHRQRLKTFLPIMQRAITVLVKKLYDVSEKSASKVDLADLLGCLTIDVVGEVAFGVPFQMLEVPIPTLDGSEHHHPSHCSQSLLLRDSLMKDLKYLFQPDASRFMTVFTNNKKFIQCFYKLMSLIPGTNEYKAARNLRFLLKQCKEIVNSRREEGCLHKREDLLSFMMTARIHDSTTMGQTANGRQLDDEELTAVVREILSAGSETTTNTASFVIAALCKHPHVMSKLLAEIDCWYNKQHAAARAATIAVTIAMDKLKENGDGDGDGDVAAAIAMDKFKEDGDGDGDGAIAIDKLKEEQGSLTDDCGEAEADCETTPKVLPFADAGMELTLADIQSSFPYLDQVIRETLRMYGPIMKVGRRTMEDTEVGGYFITEGTSLFINLTSIHYDQNNFPDPEEFRPERFANYGGDTQPSPEESDDAQQRANGKTVKLNVKDAWLPFGQGPRRCPGKEFALLELKLLLIRLLHHFDFALAHDRNPSNPQVEIEAQITLRPKGGLPVTVQRRQQRHL